MVGSQSDSPVLSVVTPVYNGTAFIADALRSVRHAYQRGASIEHIIMDGGSTDGTLDIVEAERHRDDSPITKVVSEPDEGQADAINRGFALAKGKYVAWLNADDVYVPFALADMAERLCHASSDVVLGRCEFVDRRGSVVFAPVPPSPVTPGALLKLLTNWYAGRSIVQPEAFVLRSVFESSGGLDSALHYTMDHEFWLRLAMAGATFESVDAVVAKQLVHPGQKTADNAAVVREQLRYALSAVTGSPEVFGDDLADVRNELGILERRLVQHEEILSVIGSALRGTEFVPPRSESVDSRVLQVLRNVSRKASGLLCVGLSAQEVSGAVTAVAPSRSPVVVGRLIDAPGSFDVVVARPTAAFGNQWRTRLAGCVREGGYLVILGDADVVRVGELVKSVRTEASNRLTWGVDREPLLAAHRIVLQQRFKWQALFHTQTDELSLHEVCAEYYGSNADHPLLNLAKSFGITTDLLLWRSGVWRKA